MIVLATISHRDQPTRQADRSLPKSRQAVKLGAKQEVKQAAGKSTPAQATRDPVLLATACATPSPACHRQASHPSSLRAVSAPNPYPPPATSPSVPRFPSPNPRLHTQPPGPVPQQPRLPQAAPQRPPAPAAHRGPALGAHRGPTGPAQPLPAPRPRSPARGRSARPSQRRFRPPRAASSPPAPPRGGPGAGGWPGTGPRRLPERPSGPRGGALRERRGVAAASAGRPLSSGPVTAELCPPRAASRRCGDGVGAGCLDVAPPPRHRGLLSPQNTTCPTWRSPPRVFTFTASQNF